MLRTGTVRLRSLATGALAKRSLSSTLLSCAKINNTRDGRHFIMTSIVEDLNKGNIKTSNPAVEAADEFGSRGTINNNADLLVRQREYKQLPDDSQFIEKHYDELIYYRKKLGKNFADFSNARELFLELSKFFPTAEGKKNSNINTLRQAQEVPLVKFNKFIKDLKITLMLNGGHLFVLDLLIQNKSIFDNFEKKLKKN